MSKQLIKEAQKASVHMLALAESKKSQQKKKVTEEQVSDFWDSIWHRDRCGDYDMEYDEFIDGLKDLGLEIEDE